jgi:hypothetical protein
MDSTNENALPESRPESPTSCCTGPTNSKTACEHFCEFGRERPGTLALWCLGLGFILGWKLKLW